MNLRRSSLARVGLALLGAVALCFVPSAGAFAAGEGISLTTSPVSVVLNAKPGTATSTILHVQNNAPEAVFMRIKMFTFSAAGTSGKPALLPATPSDTFLNWASFSPSTFIAQPDVPIAVTMTINVPPTASLGYNYGVAFEPVTSTNASSGATISGSNIILVLLDTTSSNEIHSVRIAGFTTSHHIYEYLPVDFNINVHNNGNIFLAPGGDIFISKSSSFAPGSIVATLPVNQAAGNILPNSNRVFPASWTNGFPVYVLKKIGGSQVLKNGKPVYQLNWNFSQANNFRFGKYYAKVILTYVNDQRQIPVSAVISFWVLPWKLMGIILLIVIIVAGLIISDAYLFHRVRKMRRNREKASAKIGDHKPEK